MGGIFISYRRHDSAGWTGRLSERLEQCFDQDQIFMDIEKIEAGSDFVEAIESAVGSCAVLLAVIGPAWLTSADAEGKPRLDNPEDFIRLEIATALKRNIRVIPVLVGGAVMPAASGLPDDLKPLTRRQAQELTDNRWDYDTEQLVKIIEKAGIKRGADARPAAGTAVQPPQRLSKKAVASIVTSALILLSLIQDNAPTLDTKIGSLVIALIALALGGFAFLDTRLNRTRGKTLAITGIVLSSLTLLVDIGLLSTHETSPKPSTQAAVPLYQPQPPSSQPVYPEQPPVPPATPTSAAANLSGVWAGSDGLTYSIEQQGNMLVFAGGYPNQAMIISGRGIVRGQDIDLDYMRLSDGTGGKARLRVSADRRSLQGQFRNVVNGEAGAMILSR